MPEPGRLKGPRRWEGLPGVTYPEEAEPHASHRRRRVPRQRGTGRPDAALWLSTAESADYLNQPPACARARMRRSGITCTGFCNGLFWLRAEVERLSPQSSPEDISPSIWAGEVEARRLLRCSRSYLFRVQAKGKMRILRVLLRRRHRVLYHRDDIATLRAIMSQEETIRKTLDEWR